MLREDGEQEEGDGSLGRDGWTRWTRGPGAWGEETQSSTSEMIIMSDVCFVWRLLLLLLYYATYCYSASGCECVCLCVCLLYDLCLSDVIYSSKQMLKFDLQ